MSWSPDSPKYSFRSASSLDGDYLSYKSFPAKNPPIRKNSSNAANIGTAFGFSFFLLLGLRRGAFPRSLRSSLCMNLLLPDFSYMYYKITRPETVYDFSHRSRFYVLLYHKAGFPTTRNLQDIKRLFPFLFIFCPGFPTLLFPPRYVGFQKRNAA